MDPSGFRIKKVGEDLPDEKHDEVLDSKESADSQDLVITPPPQQKKSSLRLANRSAADSSASQSGATCPECKASVEDDVILCISCGFNIQKGKSVDSKYKRAKKSKATFPNQQRSHSRNNTKPSAFSNILFLLIVFGGIGGGAWYFLKPLPPVYGPYKTADSIQSKVSEAEFSKVYEYGNDKYAIVISAWREMEAHYDGKTMHIEAKKNGKVFKSVKALYFKRPKTYSINKIEILFDSADYRFFQQGQIEGVKSSTTKINKERIDYSKPKNVAIKFLRAFLMKDQNGIIESVLEDSVNKLLWEGKPISKDSLAKLDLASYRVPKEGEFIMAPYGRKIQAYHFSFYKTTIIPVVGGKDIPYPIFLIDVSDGEGKKEWRVDPTIYITTIELKKKAKTGSK